MIIRQNQNQSDLSQAPTLGQQGSGVIGSGQGQAKNISGKGSGFTNLQSYISANEPESGKGNANVQLVKSREQQAQDAQQKAQSDFSNQASQVKQGLQGVQGIQNLVTSSVNDPTKVQSNDIQRIRNLATGKEAFKNPNDYVSQIQSSAGNLGTQRGNISQSLQTDTGAGLQDWLRNQRANPEQATMGESRLDRFLTQSTPSGVSAIEQAQQRAKEIQSLQTPEEVAQINQFASQLNPNLTSGESIQNYLNQSFDPEKQFLSNLNRDYASNQLGISGKVNAINQEKQPLIDQMNRLQGDLDRTNQQLAAGAQVEYGGNENFYDRKARLEAGINQYRDWLAGYDKKIGEINNQLSGSRQDVLQRIDPNRLARIQALAQLSGQDISSLLQGGLV